VIIGPAGKDMQMLPATVAEFHTLNDARKASQLVLSSDPASQSSGASNSYSFLMVQVGPDIQAVGGGGNLLPAKRQDIDQPAYERLLLLEQPRAPASQASPSCHRIPGRSGGWRTTSSTVLISISVPPWCSGVPWGDFDAQASQ
jgi:hypothetical protein